MGTTARYSLRSIPQYTRALIFFLLIAGLLTVTFLDPAISRKWTVALIAAGVALVWYVVLLRPRLVLDPAGLHIRNSFTDRFVPWASYRGLQLHLGFGIESADDAGTHQDRVSVFPTTGGFSFARENYFGRSSAKSIPTRAAGNYRATATAYTAAGLIRRLAEAHAEADAPADAAADAPAAARTVRVSVPAVVLTALGVVAQVVGLWLTLS